MKLHTFVFLFTFCSSIAAFSLPYGLNEFKNNSNLPSIVQNSAEQCDKAKCIKKCNCCPGYSIRMSIFWETCTKCNCGKNFGCNLNAKNKICLCPAGYSEQSGTCKADCKNNPCQNNGRCIVKNDNIVCNCKEPYMGELCEKVLDLCKEVKCYNEGKCNTNSGKCDCSGTNYTGEKCEELTNEQCEQLKENCYTTFGKCRTVDAGETIECLCPVGQGYIETDGCKDLCKGVNCYNEGKCNIKYGKCDCSSTEYTGEKCEELTIGQCEQLKENCYASGGKCTTVDLGQTIECLCPPGQGYTETEGCIDLCKDVICYNEGKCQVKSGQCDCSSTGYTGEKCEELTNAECEQLKENCYASGGKCRTVDLGQTIECLCPPGQVYTETEGCTECRCKNGKCTKMSGKIKCICYPEYGEYYKGDCRECKCGRGANCTFETRGLFEDKKKICACPDGFKEVKGKCEDICKDDNDCSNGGKCKISEEGSLQICHCLKGTDGPKCENVKECKAKDCGSEATCTYNIDEESTFCKCNTEEMTFHDKDKKCKHACKGDNDCGSEATCTYNIDGESRICKCNAEEMTFDDKDKKCKHVCKDDDGCSNGGKCKISEEGSLQICNCLKGTDGPKCENVKECKTKDCGSEATCTYNIDEESTFCKCNTEELTFDDKAKKCKHICKDDNDCSNGGKCKISEEGSLKICHCLKGTDGPKCENVKECKANFCGSEATCTYNIEEETTFCKCNTEEMTFDDKDKKCKLLDGTCVTLKPKCEETGGSCISAKNKTILCTCPTSTEYKDDIGCQVLDGTCSMLLPNCEETGGSCISAKNKHILCSCPTGTEYKDDIGCQDKCSNVTCLNGGKCIIKGEKAACNCTDKYTGNFCETDLTSLDDSGDDIFISVFFKNRSLSTDSKLDFHFSRKETSNRTITELLLRLNSKSVARPTDDKCSLKSCQNGGTCEVKNEKAACSCTDEYTGDYCEKSKCSLIKCQNGGNCQLYDGKAICICPDNYFGEYCENHECSLNKCKNGGKCEIKNGNAVCICPDRYTGNYCETDKCSLVPCKNGGRCDIVNGTARCICHDNYTGDSCETDKCSLIRCHNGGKCDVKNGEAVCMCNDEHIGDFCEIGKCSLIRCMNGGKCEIKNQKAVCVCNDKFTGDYCEKRIH